MGKKLPKKKIYFELLISLHFFSLCDCFREVTWRWRRAPVLEDVCLELMSDSFNKSLAKCAKLLLFKKKKNANRINCLHVGHASDSDIVITKLLHNQWSMYHDQKLMNDLVSTYKFMYSQGLSIRPFWEGERKRNDIWCIALWGTNRNSCFHKLSRPSKCVNFNIEYLLT